MYKRTTINESVQPRFLDIEEFMPDISECITGMIKYRKKCGRLMFTRLELRPRMYFL